MLRRNSIRLAEVTMITEIEQSPRLARNHAFYGPKTAYLARFGDFFIPCKLTCVLTCTLCLIEQKRHFVLASQGREERDMEI